MGTLVILFLCLFLASLYMAWTFIKRYGRKSIKDPRPIGVLIIGFISLIISITAMTGSLSNLPSVLIIILIIIFCFTAGGALPLFNKNGFTGFKSNHKQKILGIVGASSVVLAIFIAIIISSGGSSSSHHKVASSKPSESETYLKANHNDSDGDGPELTYDNNGKATFDIYVHKGTVPYFDSTYAYDTDSRHKDDDGNTLTKISPTHYQLNMKYDANDLTGGSNYTQVNAKTKNHKKNTLSFTGDENDSEESQEDQKEKQQKQRDKAKKQAKLQKDYPPLSSKIDISDVKSESADKLSDLGNFQLTGKVVAHADDDDGNYEVIMHVSGTDQLFMATLSEDQGDKYVGDNKDITIYGADLDPKRKVTMNMVNNGVDSSYYTDSLVAITGVDHVSN